MSELNPSDDSDDRLGVPRFESRSLLIEPPQSSLPAPAAARADDAAASSHESPAAAEVNSLRPGDSELGRPPQIPREMSPLTAADRQKLAEAENQQALRELAEAEELLVSDPALGGLGWFAHPLAGALLLGAAGALGLYLYAQLVAILGHLALQPVAVQIAGYTLLGLFSAAVATAILRIVYLYVRLRRNQQIRIEGLRELQNRTRLRWLALAKTREARERLETYLRDYPLETPRRNRGPALALSDERRKTLLSVRGELLDPNRLTTSGEWFDQFRLRFQAVLDQTAQERIHYWANRAMLVTAVSPNSFIDSMATAYFSFAMLADLCQVYHLKAGRTGTIVLLGRVFFNAYLAGNLNDIEKIAEDQYDHLFSQGFQVLGIGVSSQVASQFLGKVGAKATTGYLNRLLLMRLGRYACRLLRPIAQD